MSDATLDRKLIVYRSGRQMRPLNDVVWHTDEEDDTNQTYEPTYYEEDTISDKISERVDASPRRTYSKLILIMFVIGITVVVAGVVALVASPLYATRDMITVLFLVCAAGVALLSFVLKQAEELQPS